MLLHFTEDILCYITNGLALHNVLKMLSTNKRIYAMRKRIILGNEKYLKYRAFDEPNNYLNILYNSTIRFDYDRYFDIFNISYNDSCLHRICNTTQIISFEVFMCKEKELQARTFLCYYYDKKISELFGYTMSDYKYTTCIQSFNYIFEYRWELLNIELFDIYQIMVHIYSRNYDSLRQIMCELHFVKTPDLFTTFNTLLAFYHKLNYNDLDMQIMAVLIYIMYAFVDYIGLAKMKENVKFNKVMYEKADGFIEEIQNLQYLPFKIKRLIKNKIITSAQKLT